MAGKASKRTLKIEGFSKVPQRAIVRRIMERGLRPLSGVLTIDFSGKAKNATYTFVFENTYQWMGNEKIGHRRWPAYMGISESVNTEALAKMNYCDNSFDAKTCTVVYPRSENILGKVIANTALHEIGHMFGLLDKKSYRGSDNAGHTGDPSNFMFDIPLHKDYRSIGKKDERTKKYVIKKGETLAAIARKKGYGSGALLAKIRGKDGLSNQQILASAIMRRGGIGLGAVDGAVENNPSFAGQTIWVPDIAKNVQFRRKVETQAKSFSKDQISYMRKWIAQGKTMLSVE